MSVNRLIRYESAGEMRDTVRAGNRPKAVSLLFGGELVRSPENNSEFLWRKDLFIPTTD